MNPVAIHGLALLAYTIAAVLYGANFALRVPKYLTRARFLLTVGLLLHTAGIGTMCLATHRSPFATSLGTLSVAAWTMVVIYLPVELLGRVPALGAFVAPVACVFVFAAILRAGSSLQTSPAIRTHIISLHVMMVLFSLALFTMAACCAGFYIWQYGILKKPDRRALFRRLPPLETVDSLAYHLVAFALPLLTLGLALGIVREIGTRASWLGDPHTIVSVVIWLVYCVYLFARIVIGWRGTRLNYLLIAGLAVSMALFLIPSSIHRTT